MHHTDIHHTRHPPHQTSTTSWANKDIHHTRQKILIPALPVVSIDFLALSGEAGAGGARWLALIFKCDTQLISIMPRYQICFFEKDLIHINLEPDEIRLEKDIFCGVVWKIMKCLLILFVCEMPNIECDQCFKRNKGCDVQDKAQG